MSPDETGSRPATRFSTVDLPQPLGPTSVKNSPSRTVNVKSWRITRDPKRFSTFSNRTSGIRRLAFHGARGQSAHDVPMEQQDQHQDRQGDDNGSGGDLTPA